MPIETVAPKPTALIWALFSGMRRSLKISRHFSNALTSRPSSSDDSSDASYQVYGVGVATTQPNISNMGDRQQRMRHHGFGLKGLVSITAFMPYRSSYNE